jgi:hypothetical protein
MRRPFCETLRDLRAGAIVEQLDEELQQLVQQVIATGKAGAVKLTVSVKPMKGATDALVVLADIEAKRPAFDDVGTLMFATPEGNLARNNLARQPELPGIVLASDSTGEAAA